MKTVCSLLVTLALSTISWSADERPNVVVIAIDDLNDWIGCLDGHPQVKTPHIDRLAERGMLFTNAHVQATYCGPSRISLLAGKLPSTTGCYEFSPRYDQAKTLEGHPPFPMHFRKGGYATFGGGKIFHGGTGKGWVSECWETVLPSGPNPRPKEAIHWPERRVWDWGPFPDTEKEMGDFILAQNAADVLRQQHDQPIFVTAGFRRPHVPLHVPQKWFDLYSLESLQLPEIPADDLDDVPHPEIGLEPHLAPAQADLVKRGLQKSLTQAYLASISFVDHCVGEVLRGLDEGPNRETTIVVLFSDHGFHLGEKQHWAKRTLWEETTRVPLIIAGPGIDPGLTTGKPAGLIDLYPTLCEWAGLSSPESLEGQSLMPLLKNPTADWTRPALTTYRQNEHSARSEHWRYIRYSDGTEELYDHRKDPNEWTNLASDERFSSVKEEHALWLPKN